MTASNTNTPTGDLVYVIQTTKHGPIKVGLTSNLERRISEIQTGNPLPVNLVGWFPCENRAEAASLEKEIHALLHRHRMSGEWFGGAAIPVLMKSEKRIVLNGTNKKLGIAPLKPCKKAKLSSNNRFLNHKKKWCGDYLFGKSKTLYLSIKNHDKAGFSFHGGSCNYTDAEIINDELAVADKDSLHSLRRFYDCVTQPDMWHKSAVSKDNNAIVAWRYGNEYITAEFVGSFKIIASLDIADTRQDGVSISHQTAALYQKIASGTFSFKNKPNRERLRKAA